MTMPGAGISLWKVLGTFGIFLMILIWLGPTLAGIGKATKTGEWSEVLKNTGGRIFVLDKSLSDETDYLLNPIKEEQMYTRIFHLSYAITLIFMMFFIAFLLFRFGNWLIGIKSLSPSSDIMIIVAIILIFLLVEFFYAWAVLGVVIIPLKDGVLKFIINLPKILNMMIS